MADDLGAQLVQAGLVTRAQLTNVLGSAPPHEGALVQRLSALGLDEDAIAGFFVAAGFGPMMDRTDLRAADAAALGRVPARMAYALSAIPVRSSAAGLVVAMAAPSDSHAISELARAAGGPILPTVARLADLREALAAAYPTPRPSSGPPAPSPSEPPVLELVRRRSTDAPSHPSSRTPMRGPDEPWTTPPLGSEAYGGSTRGADRVEARALVGPRLSPPSEEDDAFVPLVRHKPVASSPPPQTPTRQLERKVVTKRFEKLQKSGETPGKKAGSWARGSDPPLGPAVTPRTPRAKAESEELVVEIEIDELQVESLLPNAVQPDPVQVAPKSLIPPEHARWDIDAPENKVDARKLERFPSAPAKRPPKPAPIGAALKAIRTSRQRDEIVELACQAVLTTARAAVLLTLRKSVLKGLAGAGVGLSRDSVRNLWIPTSSPSMFRDVVDRREPYCGAHGTSAADGLFRAALGSRGGDVALMPVMVGDKLIGILAADDLRFGTLGTERVEQIARAMGAALERLIVDLKKS